MSSLPQTHIILANGAKGPNDATAHLRLHYIQGHAGYIVRMGLPKFVQDVYHLPPRILDLLEIAGYVFAADRCVTRGPRAAVEYHTWSRSLHPPTFLIVPISLLALVERRFRLLSFLEGSILYVEHLSS